MSESLTFSFLADGEELQLPVPPLPFGWGAAQNVRELTVNGTGTVTLPGDPASVSGTLEILLPAHDYPFNQPGAVLDPYYYVERFKGWIAGKKIVRYVVPGVLNERVVLQELTYQERDGTGDVYATLYLRSSPPLEAVTTQNNTGMQSGTGSGSGNGGANTGRAEPETSSQAQTYTVVAGDCLSVICRRFYGSGTDRYYNALAAYNGIRNPHLIRPGQVITLPPKEQLGL